MPYKPTENTLTPANFTSLDTFDDSGDIRFPHALVDQSNGGDYIRLPAGEEFIKAGGRRSTGNPNYLGRYLLNRFSFTNQLNQQTTRLEYWTDTNPANRDNDHSTHIATSAGSSLAAGYDYGVDIEFIPEPCIPDGAGPRARSNDFSNITYHLPANTATRGTSVLSGFMVQLTEPLSTIDGAQTANHILSDGTARGDSATTIADLPV